MENSLLNSFYTGSLDPKSSVVTTSDFARCRNQLGCSLESETLVETIFMTSVYLANAGADSHHFGILPLTY